MLQPILQKFRFSKRAQGGMTLVEMVIAVGMLVIFTATVASVLSFTQSFLRQTETVDGSDTFLANIGSNGLLVDQHQLQLVMDDLVLQLQQPGWSAAALKSIAGDPKRQCTYDPVFSWKLMGPALTLPPRYRICLRTSSLTEPTDVKDANGNVTISAFTQLAGLPPLTQASPPGIYILQALPDQLDASTLPARRLFCRPRPFC